MSKRYSIELKIKLVNEYLTSNHGFKLLEDKYNVERSLIRTWVEQFKDKGVQGLKPGITSSNYSKSFMHTALLSYHKNAIYDTT